MFEKDESTTRGFPSPRRKPNSEQVELDEAKEFNEIEIEILEKEFCEEIRKLKNYDNGPESLFIPSTVDEAIKRGLTHGIEKQRSQRIRKLSTLVACFILVIFITSIRVSPAFAAALHQIPGLGYIVELIHFDKGLQSAVDNDFLQPIGISDEHENIIFTVDGIIIDESSLAIFYTLENKRGYGEVGLSEVRIYDEQGNPLVASIGYGSSANPDQDGDGKIQAQIGVYFVDPITIPDRIGLSVKLREQNPHGVQNPAKPVDPIDTSIQQPTIALNLSSTWKINIPVDKDRFAGMKTVYELNQSVIVEGQKITFETVTVYPTRMALNVAYDSDNSKRIFAFDDLTLVNEKGEEWGRIMNGVSGSKLDENHEILYFQSHYFTQPKKLFLQGKSIRTLDKEDTKVTLDLEAERILAGPPNLTLDKVLKNPTGVIKELQFKIKNNPDYDENRSYSIFAFHFNDANGESFDTGGQGASNDKFEQILTVSLPENKRYQSPITFELTDYPSRIFGEINIQIK